MDQTSEEHWRDLSERILTEISEWRRSHPKATFREIEDEVHLRMSRLEAQLIGGYGAAEYEPKLERSEPARATNVSPLSHPVTCAREATTQATRSRRTRSHTEPRVWDLPKLWDRSFSPSMRNEPYSQVA